MSCSTTATWRVATSASLDLATGAATVRYTQGAATFTRTVVASHPDQVVAMHLACNRPGLLRFSARLSSPLHAATRVEDDALVLRGRAPSHVEPNYEDVPDRCGTPTIAACISRRASR